MYRTISDFTQDWNEESASTRKLLDHITDASLSQAIRPGGRTLGRLAWHIVLTLVEMPAAAGITVEGPHQDAPVPATAAEIAAEYSKTAVNFAVAVAAQWASSSMEEEVPIYGEVWSKGRVLSVLVKHEIHHRAQLTVLMRQAGLPVPGLYGPAEEEWSAIDLPPQP